MARHLCLLLLLVVCSLFVSTLLAPPWLFPRTDKSMRLCRPLRLDKLRSYGWSAPCQASTRTTTTTATMTATMNAGQQTDGSLVRFLREQKRAFLGALERGDAHGWVVVMGNEAGDLDSLASSIAYASLASTLSTEHTLPLLLTPRKYMSLRPENALALNKALIPADTQHDIFLHLEELPVEARTLARLGVKFALVDHNTLLPPFRGDGQPGETETEDPVVAIIDHHADDGNHAGARPRVIQIPTGSTTSLVTMFFKEQWQRALDASPPPREAPPPELATLLLSGILIDTSALKAGLNAKTTPTDRAAAEFLSRVGATNVGQNNLQQQEGARPQQDAGMTVADLEAGKLPSSVAAWAEQLFAAKNDVSRLSTHDLLFRDYKEYAMPTSARGDVLTVGLSTVPLALASWLSRDQHAAAAAAAAAGIDPGWKPFMLAMDAWMHERNLDVAGVLTTFNDPLAPPSPGASPTTTTTKTKGKHRRELALFVRARGEPASPRSVSRARAIAEALIEGVNAAGDVLDVDVWKPSKPFKNTEAGEALVQGLEDELMRPQRVGGGDEATRFGCVWRQGNASSTRKQVAPLIKEIIAGIPGPETSGL
ncbi:hypothetical protein NliqN6_6144 [Naganishia liquefaciens]|uniref:DHHA2 domain-containing protein n=1 Tax=Naganishia liquefaciens TaxID=104408 RepID=A0A8H3YJ26_9TREE|nr:hypothetical protein NliqN6_6144 [Naganishia liquefaciens]